MASTIRQQKCISILFVLIMLAFYFGAAPTVSAATPAPFFQSSGDLLPGMPASITYPVINGSRETNMKIVLTGGAGGFVTVSFADGAGGPSPAFSQKILPGETLWSPFTLKKGNNTFTLTNGGTASVSYQVYVYDRTTPAYTWSGVSLAQGTWPAQIRLTFPTSGLYEFNFTGTKAPYQFLLDSSYIQKTVSADQKVNYYVPQGEYLLTIDQSANAAVPVEWNVAITAAPAANDSLPYQQTGGKLGGPNNDLTAEWMPIALADAAETNYYLAISGSPQDTFTVKTFNGATQVGSDVVLFGGEKVWWPVSLPAGVNRVQFQANAAAAPIEYQLIIAGKPAVTAENPLVAAGYSLWNGESSRLVFSVPAAGLYEFQYGVNDGGRFQFAVDQPQSGDPYLLKTVKAAGSVAYYLAAGNHTLLIDQDYLASAAPANWSMKVLPAGAANDPLPYVKSGGELSGTNNVFTTEWLPVNLAEAADTNLNVKVTGSDKQYLTVEVYANGALLSPALKVYGGETAWLPRALPAGNTRIKISADAANSDRLSYELRLEALPAAPAAFSGVALSSVSGASVPTTPLGAYSKMQFRAPADGAYQITLNNAAGFSQVLVDESVLATALSTDAKDSTYLAQLKAGVHSITVKQAVDYPSTAWVVNVASTAPGAVLANFKGTLTAGEQIAPQFPWFEAGNLEVNFKLVVGEVTGNGVVALNIANGANTGVFTGSALDGETVWNTTTLTQGANTFTLKNTGALPVSYDLTVYTVPSAPFTPWSGVSQGVGSWKSSTRVSFPTSGLYTFTYNTSGGRYQFFVDDNYVEKTVDTSKTPDQSGSATFFVPAGLHKLTILQEAAAPSVTWNFGISAPVKPNDELPTGQVGLDLGGASNQFTQEWLPLSLPAAAKVNFLFQASGDKSDIVTIKLYSGAAGDQTIHTVTAFGSESLWWTTELPAGVSRVQLAASSNNPHPLSYQLSVQALPTATAAAPVSWSGRSVDTGVNSKLRFIAEKAALYSFDYTVAQGRYQFKIANNFIVKTAEQTGKVVYYLPAGEHEMQLVQDGDTPATGWTLSIGQSFSPTDVLPLTQTGGTIGGAGNDFTTEWLPITLAQAQKANFNLKLTGLATDKAAANVYAADGTTVLYTATVYGGETFWWPLELGAGVSRVEIVANGNNTGKLSYELNAQAMPGAIVDPGTSWSGSASKLGSHSIVQVNVAYDGEYKLVLSTTQGAANLLIPSLAQSVQYQQGGYVEFVVTLEKGIYLFEVEQNTFHDVTDWQLTVVDLSPKLYLPMMNK